MGFKPILALKKLSRHQGGKILDILEHYNSGRYENQYIYGVNINEYAYLVPFVKKSQSEIFLKTVFPSRKLKRQYLGKKKEDRDYGRRDFAP